MNDVDPRGDTDQATGICPYCEAVDRIYDSPEAWAETTAARLESCGFNTVGARSEADLFAPLMPYTVWLNYGGGQADFFSEEFLERVATIAEQRVVPLRDDTGGPLVPIDGWLSAYYELSGLLLIAPEFSLRSRESDPPNT